MKTEVINTRVEPGLKKSVAAILRPLGLSTSDAISIFLHQVALNKGIPFDVRLPNEKTKKAIENAVSGKNLTRYESVKALKKDMGAC